MSQFQTQETAELNEASRQTIKKQLLNFEIKDAGANLSVGQKQLICIARALIKAPEILLMDEATSNIDEQTDKLIQQVIKHEFRDTTIGNDQTNPSYHRASTENCHAL